MRRPKIAAPEVHKTSWLECPRLVRTGLDERYAGIARRTKLRIERYLREQRHGITKSCAERARYLRAAAGTEDVEGVYFAAVRTCRHKVRHVLHNADHPLVHHRRHGAGTLGHLCGSGLRRGDYQD